jgi:hypothetical protein
LGYIEERKNYLSEGGILLVSGLLQTGVEFNLCQTRKAGVVDVVYVNIVT